MDLEISPTLRIPGDELSFSYARSGGPGGQNVNKVESKVLLRWRIDANTNLPQPLMERLRSQQRGRLTTEGELLITSQRTRDQDKNKQDCLAKLAAMVRTAATPPKPRRPTKPTKASNRRRLSDKKVNAVRKAGRKSPGDD